MRWLNETLLFIAKECQVAVLAVDHIPKSSYLAGPFKLLQDALKGSTAKAQAASSLVAVQPDGNMPGQ
jgi:hypothetical protein